MESNAPASFRSWLTRPGCRWALVIALVLYGALLIRHVDACAGGSDSSGYMNHARLLALGHLHTAPRALPGLNPRDFSDFLYTPLGFVPKDGALVPTYPVGMPLMILAVHYFAGWAHAGDVVIVGHALAALALLFLLGRELRLGRAWCWAATIGLAASPLFLEFSLQAMSDVPALAWTTGAAWAIWRARTHPRWAAGAGLIFAVAVLIRPTNVLMIAPLVAAWWPDAWDKAELGGKVGCLARFAAGGLPAAIGFALHSHAAYGHWLTTGYGDASSLFTRSVVPLTLRHYAHWMPVVFTPLVWFFLGLPIAAWRSREARFLLAWGAAYLGFYVSYFHTHEDWWYLRFVLPAAPAFIGGALWVVRWIARRATAGWTPHPAAAMAAFLLALAGIGATELRWDKRWQVLAVGHGEAGYRLAMDWLKIHAPPNAVLTVMQASGAAFYYTDFIAVRWDQMSPQLFPEVAAAAARDGRPIYAPLFPFETESALHERMPGRWDRMGQVRDIVIWRWAGGSASSAP
jgi:4-amino-4-deoxy-L-arabinose transferase-like glycosyltransferase